MGIILSRSENKTKWLASGMTASSAFGDTLGGVNGMLEANEIMTSINDENGTLREANSSFEKPLH